MSCRPGGHHPRVAAADAVLVFFGAEFMFIWNDPTNAVMMFMCSIVVMRTRRS